MKKTRLPETMPTTIFPQALIKGDTIGLVMPAGPVTDEKNFIAGVNLLKEAGFQIKTARDPIATSDSYLAGDDRARADEFHTIWADPDVKCVMAVRGGFGCMRLLEHLDLDLIKRNPKLFVGFSDITVLLNYISDRTGLVTLHGPVVTTLARSDRRSVHSFFNALTGRMDLAIKPDRLEILSGGDTVRGKLIGGNLTTLAHLLATRFEPSFNDSILFIEDVDEAPYRIDRLLTQLKMAGRFDSVKGIIIGSFSADLNNNSSEINDEPVWERVLGILGDSGKPIWANFPVGHGSNNITLPVGIEATLDSSAGVLRIEKV